ncbi:hypothetical protein K6U06_01030 [Acidiferrimicrobium sp. IK]|uniref:hypothetical protein n=1 Tax=Acidiferrimicrobium sp. IK TaxID=2871700 RepID=UPI0021CB5213|nr:hypothetical protein [Acidiferrimicrobium sp. IK]MCU4182931.1 hypothetical protein [Acidiferrimicrobium sp. IK]
MAIFGGHAPGRGLLAAAAACAACLLTGGCASSSSGTSAATTAPPATAASSTSSTTAALQVGGPQFCQQLVSAEQKLTAAIPSLSSAPDAVDGLVPTYQTLASEAPAAIKSPVQDLATVLKDLAGASGDPTAAQRQIQALQTKAGPDAESIGTWLGMHCSAG